MPNYILYKKADFDDTAVLAELRVAMLCEIKECGPDRLKSELFDNTKQYIEDGFKNGSFIAWAAIDSHSKILAASGLTLYALPPNGWCPNGKTAYIGNLYTLPEYRKKGIATHLFELNIEEAKKNDCQRILLDVADNTDAGKSFYEKYGFEKSDTSMAYYPFRKKQLNFIERLGIYEQQ